ncbi:VOC family protein [Paenisporosarcina sp. TG20]|uniref:VOC family protein n=1 Tax=Paenisporosarcina sp. TG20 TaxID=1211706 RepID=UPI0003199EBB|nr:VOC family protein [Paenisporosarcina sp. TG20]
MIELDHVVYFSKDSPEVLVQKNIGTAIGGRHKAWGTVNALTYTKNSYIEYLSVENLDVAKQANHPLTKLLLNDLESGEGWGTICFRTENIDKLNERLCRDGWGTSGVLDAERETASGFIRKWKMLFINQEVSNELPYPFFIQWEETFEERMQSLREDGTITSVNDNLAISRCDFAVYDSQKKLEEWSEILKVSPSNNSLKLPNTELLFLESKAVKERLVSIHTTKNI